MYLLALLFLASPLAAMTDAAPYRLHEGTTFQEGCFDPCLCPLLSQVEMVGGFTLAPAGLEGSFEVYAISDVAWDVPVLGRRISGSGTYRLSGNGEHQQLVLDLSINDGPVETYDSGLVPAGAEFPAIEATVTINNYYCFDRPLSLKATPLPITIDVHDADLSWTPMPGATGYDVVSGDLTRLVPGGDFTGSTMACLAEDVAGSPLAGLPTPAPGEAFWFLVRDDGGSYDAGASSQSTSRDPGVNASPAACN